MIENPSQKQDTIKGFAIECFLLSLKTVMLSKMEANADFDIRFSGLKDGVHTFEFVSESFFETFDNEEFNAVAAKAVVNLHKKPLMEVEFSSGHGVNCS